MSWFVIPLSFALTEAYLFYWCPDSILHWLLIAGIVLGIACLVYKLTRTYKAVFIFLLIWFTSTIYFIFPLLSLLFLSQDVHAKSGYVEILMALAALVLIIASNALVISRPKETKVEVWAFIISAFTVIILIVLLGGWFVIPEKIMSIYGFGNIQQASIIVDDEGCGILKRLDVAHKCDNRAKINKIDNIVILSRLGNTYLLSYKMTDKRTLKFTLPSRVILSWAVIQNENKTTSIK